MKNRLQVELAFHGTVMLTIGLLCGFPFAAAIVDNWGEVAVRGWRVAHLALIIGAIWIYALTAAWPYFGISAQGGVLIRRILLATIYGFTVALVVGAAGSARGIEPGGPVANWIAFTGNTIGALGGLATTLLLLRGSFMHLRSIPPS